ncbi:cell cycle checkpoint protein RAD17 isoform X1 [Scyliorhinus canicula]|uniref:cell cycle checkpoint protein RAD17 isoform X1 n=1 Tax=Scyliorhinus canicula TaxID=7830 RepID=UPI0018F3AEC0|nr:cell cycle checkpoint protein RAD17 isoform X1 [Scyliorhinus canicula]XP_038661326.1 cell cycle checkpoint protein RAD17 isoform X1 [Scyliorhinus canicula]
MMSKSSLSRKVISAKVTNWVNPSFDGISNSTLPLTSDRKPSSNLGSSGGVQKTLWTERDKTLQSSSLSSTKSRKRTKVSDVEQIFDRCRQNSASNPNEPWVDEYRPQTQSELAVHKKKIEEVENWLKAHTIERDNQQGSSILLLTGAAGIGKTATIQVLVKELEIQLLEWTNPLSDNKFKNYDEFKDCFNHEPGFQVYASKSQTTLFQEFLLRANKYKKLQMLGDRLQTDKKLILVEDMPNQFYREPSCMHDILRRFKQTARCPLVFIISDSISGDSSHRLLFPKDIQEELAIFNISFNPVAPTSMLKVLSRIASQEASKNDGKTVVPDKSVLEMLCKGSAGDIRTAINSLQFTSVKGCPLEQYQTQNHKGKPLIKTGTSSRGKYKEKSSKANEKGGGLNTIGSKDQSLFLFRALGKIIYCKRELPNDLDLNPLPIHLSEHERDPLLVNPEEVIENSHMSEELFNLYLHQNYLDFFNDIEDIVRASDYLSDADFLTVDWNHRSTLQKYSASVAARGLIHANKARARANCKGGAGFKPLHKPQWLSISKKYKENCLAAKGFFSQFCLAPFCLQTQLLPYLALLTNPMRNQAQINFIQDVGRFPFKRYSTRSTLETLTDRDPGILELDNEEEEYSQPRLLTHDQPTATSETQTTCSTTTGSLSGGGDLPSSQPQPTITQSSLEEEELVIDEYDSN